LIRDFYFCTVEPFIYLNLTII